MNLIEFDFSKECEKEMHEKALKEELHGAMSVNFENEEDYITKLIIDIDDVISFVGGKVWYNDMEINGTYVKFTDRSWSGALLISVENFKQIFEKQTGKKVLNYLKL